MIDITNYYLPFVERIICMSITEQWWSIHIGRMKYIWIFEKENVFEVFIHTVIPVEQAIDTMTISTTCFKEQKKLEACVHSLYENSIIMNSLKKLF